ncbi:MAG: YcjF family protein [Treponema sp.]|jgi:uncharacterized protein (DUF697 family)|nr:YcjF family protein [Treponema sp.]
MMSKSKHITDSGFENYDASSGAISGVDAVTLPEQEDALAAPESIQPELPADEPVVSAEISGFDFITRARAEEIVKNRAVLAAGLGIVPVPVFTFVSTTAIQITMVQSITRLYNIEVKKSLIKNIIASVLGGGAATGLSGFAAKGLATAPLVGTSLAVLSGPALNGLTTYAIGYMFIRYFESGDGFLKANAKALGNWFKEGFKEGRERLGDAVAGKVQAA